MMSGCSTGGQVQKDYKIQFRSGAYLPTENVQRVVRFTQSIAASRFNGHYYVILQFYSLPDSSIKKKLAQRGIKLLHYLPQLAYVTKIPIGIDFKFLKNIKARSVFMLSAEQKLTVDLQKKKFPAWSVPENGYVDLTVTTFEALELSMVQMSFAELNVQVSNVQKGFATMTLRLPQRNLFRLAQLPFVFSVEAVEEPAKPEAAPNQGDQ
jgi:hypothetical protein